MGRVYEESGRVVGLVLVGMSEKLLQCLVSARMVAGTGLEEYEENSSVWSCEKGECGDLAGIIFAYQVAWQTESKL